MPINLKIKKVINHQRKQNVMLRYKERKWNKLMEVINFIKERIFEEIYLIRIQKICQKNDKIILKLYYDF